jgi:hypothetical protein
MAESQKYEESPQGNIRRSVTTNGGLVGAFLKDRYEKIENKELIEEVNKQTNQLNKNQFTLASIEKLASSISANVFSLASLFQKQYELAVKAKMMRDRERFRQMAEAEETRFETPSYSASEEDARNTSTKSIKEKISTGRSIAKAALIIAQIGGLAALAFQKQVTSFIDDAEKQIDAFTSSAKNFLSDLIDGYVSEDNDEARQREEDDEQEEKDNAAEDAETDKVENEIDAELEKEDKEIESVISGEQYDAEKDEDIIPERLDLTEPSEEDSAPDITDQIPADQAQPSKPEEIPTPSNAPASPETIPRADKPTVEPETPPPIERPSASATSMPDSYDTPPKPVSSTPEREVIPSQPSPVSQPYSANTVGSATTAMPREPLTPSVAPTVVNRPSITGSTEVPRAEPSGNMPMDLGTINNTVNPLPENNSVPPQPLPFNPAQTQTPMPVNTGATIGEISSQNRAIVLSPQSSNTVTIANQGTAQSIGPSADFIVPSPIANRGSLEIGIRFDAR